MPAPSATRFEQLYRDGAAAGLSAGAAFGYAALAWWLEHYGIQAPRITSGHRDPDRQVMLRRAWDSWEASGRKGPAPYGMVSRPATDSAHTTGDAFDVSAPPEVLRAMGAWAPLVGLRWGGTFRDPDPVHFDTRLT